MFLGVDGGGTKTAFSLVTADGRLAAEHQTRSTYYLDDPAGTDLVVEVLQEGVSEVCRRAGARPADVTYAFLGLPAYGEASALLPALDAAPRTALGHDRYRCGNDMVAGWAGSLGAVDGINVVGGTGSICYGERLGHGARVGGWGEVFGDEGSGHWIAVRGLDAFARMSDGRLPRGPLVDVVRERLGTASDLDVVGLVLGEWRGRRRDVASLSTVVAEAATRGDVVAGRILDDAAAELAGLVETAARALGFADDDEIPVSFSGGVFADPRLRSGFRRRLERSERHYALVEPRYPPSVGAALYAARLAGQPLSTPSRERLRSVAVV